MAYVDEGAGSPLLLLHGNPTWSFLYRSWIGPLSADHRVIAPDHLGFGRSAKPTTPLRLDDHIQNLERLVLHLNLRDITLAVHEWGGPIGLGFAVRHPDRIRKLTLMSTWAWPITLGTPLHPVQLQVRTPGIGEAFVQGLNLMVEGYLPSSIGDPRRINAQMMDGYRAPFPDYPSRAQILAMVRDLPVGTDHPAAAATRVIEQQLPQLHVPVLILWGAADSTTPPAWIRTRWLKIFPHAQEERFEGAGHYLIEDRPAETLDRFTRFLDSV
ncbi:MAG: alpha/beta fold hydrolase [Bryobacteraceae bacterium]|nr:alpha/beta fold hydrolase [Bryobacteraceae bacterium]